MTGQWYKVEILPPAIRMPGVKYYLSIDRSSAEYNVDGASETRRSGVEPPLTHHNSVCVEGLRYSEQYRGDSHRHAQSALDATHKRRRCGLRRDYLRGVSAPAPATWASARNYRALHYRWIERFRKSRTFAISSGLWGAISAPAREELAKVRAFANSSARAKRGRARPRKVTPRAAALGVTPLRPSGGRGGLSA